MIDKNNPHSVQNEMNLAQHFSNTMTKIGTLALTLILTVGMDTTLTLAQATGIKDGGNQARNSGGQSRIIGGKDVKRGAGPWAVTLKRNGSFACGGSLVNPTLPSGPNGPVVWKSGSENPQWVITAAHCLYDRAGNRFTADQLTVMTGTLDRFNRIQKPVGDGSGTTTAEAGTGGMGEGEEIQVRFIMEHEGYNDENVQNDIALLQLAQPNKSISFQLRSSIGLPSRANSEAYDLDLITAPYTQVYAQGWGATEDSNSEEFLQEVRLPLMDHETCNRAYAAAGAPLSPGMICAGFTRGEFDSCQGDSGGPLVFRPVSNEVKDSRLVGVVSWGIGCARPNMAGVYSSLPYFQGWLDSKFKKCNANPIAINCSTQSQVVRLAAVKTDATKNRVRGNMITGQVKLSPEGCENDPNGICRLLEVLRFEQSPDLVWESDLWSSDDQQSGTTDGASIPPWARPIIGDKYNPSFLKAAILHDHYCYKENHVRSWQSVHRMFYDALLASGVAPLKAKVMYYAVYIGGPRWTKLVPGENCGLGCIKQRTQSGDTSKGEWIDWLETDAEFIASVSALNTKLENGSELSLADLESMANAKRTELMQ